MAVMLWAAVPARSAAAQELEPGAYTVSPVGVNLFNAGYTLNTGDVTFDPALPVEDGHARIHTLALSLGRAISLAGRSATLLVTAPVIGGHVEGVYRGDFTSIDRTGLGDLRVRLGVNVYGAPALRMPEFARNLPPQTTFSLGLTVVAPTGQYDPSRIINLGSHRWSFKPEAAVALRNGPWMVELYGGTWLFTANGDFLGGQTRTQDALLSTQANVRYTFRPGLWLSGNANFYTGGRTNINGRANLDFQRNSRLGTTLTIPARSRSSVRVAVSKGAYTTIGSDFLGVSVSYQRAF
jgi:hypothetical protein